VLATDREILFVPSVRTATHNLADMLARALRAPNLSTKGGVDIAAGRNLSASRRLAVAAALWRIGRAMVELPRGTVTFLFSDVEGSTRLVTHMGERYEDLLTAHERTLRAAFSTHHGCEIGTHGDEFFVAFTRASDAIRAAVAAQRGLARVRWPDGVDLRVRMGLHTGEAAVRGASYVGLDVHRAARICSAGHGGQVLVSSTTRELVADALAAEGALRDLGVYRLKDLTRPEHLFEVVHRDLAVGFPALRDGTVSPTDVRPGAR
jgi:class 3 adenylate cyclase